MELSSRGRTYLCRRPLLSSPERQMTVIAAAIERCGGIDVGKKFLAVCIMVGPLEGEPHVEIQRFGTTVLELRRVTRLVESGEHYTCGDGEYRLILETGVQHPGRRGKSILGQSSGCEESQRAQDG